MLVCLGVVSAKSIHPLKGASAGTVRSLEQMCKTCALAMSHASALLQHIGDFGIWCSLHGNREVARMLHSVKSIVKVMTTAMVAYMHMQEVQDLHHIQIVYIVMIEECPSAHILA